MVWPRHFCSSCRRPAQATYPGQPGKIAFVSNRDGNREIYTMNADGSNQQNITNHPGSDFNPAWSPDGSMILYTSNRIAPSRTGSDPDECQRKRSPRA